MVPHTCSRLSAAG